MKRLLAWVIVVTAPAAALAQAPDPVLDRAAVLIADAAQWEIREKQIPSIAVAIVGPDGVRWAGAWGKADAEGKVPASADTVYRAGSVSKLFTDVAVMKLVEQGKLDLDTPVRTYLPTFQPKNPFGGEITLRQLMTHRSGLVRESPRGNYFDVAPKDQADTVQSLNETALVAAPGSITKYSNAGIAVVGEVVARVTGMSFEKALHSLVLDPLGMTSSGLTAAPFAGRVAYSEMAAFDGPRVAAPPIELGMPAAGSLYTTSGDLGRFAQALLNKGAIPNGRMLNAASLDEMWRRQYPDPGTRIFGLGFVVADMDGKRVVGHGGAIYGHSTQLLVMPDAGLGVIAFTTVDASNAITNKLADYALRTVLALKAGTEPPAFAKGALVTGAEAKRLSGWFSNGKRSVSTRIYNGRLVIDAPELVGDIRRTATGYIVEDAQTRFEALALADDASWIEVGGVRYARGEMPEPPLPNAELASLVGDYGWAHNVLRIYERDGRPFVWIEWTEHTELTRTAADRYAFPLDRSLYPFEALTFERDTAGNVTAADLGGIRFPRRDFGAEVEANIRAGVQANFAGLRAAALAATPPQEPPTAKPSDLYAITAADPTIRLDVRYAGTNNFMGVPIYESARAYLQRPAAEALARVHQAVRKRGYGLLIYDAYRPWYVTKMFWDASPVSSRMFVADPSKGSRHNRGAAVDLTLFDLKTGQPVETTGRYDEFSTRSYSNFVGGTDHQRWLREVLRSAIEAEGFDVYAEEWWHFDYGDWRDYPIGSKTFEELEGRSRR
ncbi:serine hydrolase [Sphingosinicella soli]|uniref:D-alanyl-D-alanine dipeptidase n=1 Tax=Sphingosinicella soli TaxID=333708 RepID=A0A7W7AZE2_9SPHN|nr:serine hydrolase [Sphingosinicella soli]MBB4631034.1 CubicO group peptidase (beta-lactamase class C family)/D-alanyl-D-alanine dipeptidase [Sphingosinicella soli]